MDRPPLAEAALHPEGEGPLCGEVEGRPAGGREPPFDCGGGTYPLPKTIRSASALGGEGRRPERTASPRGCLCGEVEGRRAGGGEPPSTAAEARLVDKAVSFRLRSGRRGGYAALSGGRASTPRASDGCAGMSKGGGQVVGSLPSTAAEAPTLCQRQFVPPPLWEARWIRRPERKPHFNPDGKGCLCGEVEGRRARGRTSRACLPRPPHPDYNRPPGGDPWPKTDWNDSCRPWKPRRGTRSALIPGPNMVYVTGLNFHLLERPVILMLAPGQTPHFILPELERGQS